RLQASEQDHEERLGRAVPADELRVHEGAVHGPHVARDTRERARNDERGKFVAIRVVAERAHAMLVDANALENAAKERAQQEDEEEIHGDELHKRHVVEIDWPLTSRIGQLETEKGKNRPRQIGAVRAAAELGVVEDEEDHLPKSERDHEKEEAA